MKRHLLQKNVWRPVPMTLFMGIAAALAGMFFMPTPSEAKASKPRQLFQDGSSVNFASLSLDSYSVQGNDVTINTSGAAKLRVTFIAADSVRIWASSDGSFQREPSVAVLDGPSVKIDFTVSDTRDYLRIATDHLSVHVNKQHVGLDFYKADDATLISGEASQLGSGWGTDGSRFVYRRMAASEHFYGLGEDNDSYLGRLDRRGSKRDMWTGQRIAKGHVTAEIPVPFFMSTGGAGGGYGMFFDNTYRTEFNMGLESNDYYFWKSLGGNLIYYFFHGPSFASILDRYTQLTGRPSMPPLWVLGYIQSKCTFATWEEMDEVVKTMRSKEIPLDAMVIDYDWPEQLQNFRWNKRWKDQSPDKLKEYGEGGIKVMISNSGPMIRKTSSNYQSGLANHIFATDGHGSTVVCGHYGGDLMDFTAPGMKGWLWPQMRHLYDEGIRGWWLDLTEPEGEPPQTIYHGGPSAMIHNIFSLLMTKTYYDMQKEYDPVSRPFILTRTGFAGIQRYGAAIWSGDINSDYATFAAHPPEAMNTGMSGIPLWTNDSGGFLSGMYKNNLRDHGLLYERWLEFSTFSPITRAHHVGPVPAVPYGFGDSVEASARKYLALRYRLLPYIYSTMWESHLSGAPLMRPLVFTFQNDDKVFDIKDEYMFGDALMVAPVTVEGRSSREVYFPEGKWIDYDYGYEYQGNRTYVVKAPHDRIPLFVRAGAIIPMAPSMQYTMQKAWDPITLDLYPESHSRFMMYRDDGGTSAYEDRSAYTQTEVEVLTYGREKVMIALTEMNKLYTPLQYVFRVHLTATPTQVSWNGVALLRKADATFLDKKEEGFYWDAANLTLWAAINPGAALGARVEIGLAGDTLLRPLPPELPPPQEGGGNTPSGGDIRMPYFFPPPTLPGRIEAENYDKGGEGIAYHAHSTLGGVTRYRSDDAGIVESGDIGGGYDVALSNGDWLEYTVNVSKAGLYQVELRGSSQNGGALNLTFQSRPVSAGISFPGTENLSRYTAVVMDDVWLDAGEQIMRITGGGESIIRLNYANFTLKPDIAMVDDLDTFDKMFSHTAGLGFDTSNTPLFGGDVSRLTRATTDSENVVYQGQRDMSYVEVTCYYWPEQAAVDFSFDISADGETYNRAAAAVQTAWGTSGNWNKAIYRINSLSPGMRYLKITFPGGEPNWSPQIGKVMIKY